MAEVRLQEGEGIESALRRFKRRVQTEDIIKEVKRHSFYLKAGGEAQSEASIGAKACPGKDSQRSRLSEEREWTSFQFPFCARFPPKMRDRTQFWGARRALRPIEATSYEIDAEATQMQQVGG